MEQSTVECCECGKKLQVIESENVFIPQFRCNSCLKKKQ